jgi:hypothetical protein
MKKVVLLMILVALALDVGASIGNSPPGAITLVKKEKKFSPESTSFNSTVKVVNSQELYCFVKTKEVKVFVLEEAKYIQVPLRNWITFNKHVKNKFLTTFAYYHGLNRIRADTEIRYK